MYQQQVWVRAKQKIWTCPRKQFLQELSQEIIQWMEAREEVIVLADMNKDVLATILQGHRLTGSYPQSSQTSASTNTPTQ